MCCGDDATVNNTEKNEGKQENKIKNKIKIKMKCGLLLTTKGEKIEDTNINIIKY